MNDSPVVEPGALAAPPAPGAPAPLSDREEPETEPGALGSASVPTPANLSPHIAFFTQSRELHALLEIFVGRLTAPVPTVLEVDVATGTGRVFVGTGGDETIRMEGFAVVLIFSFSFLFLFKFHLAILVSYPLLLCSHPHPPLRRHLDPHKEAPPRSQE
ncbi:hypothetical protein BDZ97DRAFT_1923281 [Flammula alnicola]|nr:hypothetical protein BDZ97DRAFT_1923281 [Flammula alnicola]